jgi:hypothetical protein
MTFEQIHNQCDFAGCQAAEKTVPMPMVVQEHASPIDDESPVVRQWVVRGGVCGFAWIELRKRTHQYARWIKERHIGRSDDYTKSIMIWVSNYGQSMAMKEAYAQAYVRELHRLQQTEPSLTELKAVSCSRMD